MEVIHLYEKLHYRGHSNRHLHDPEPNNIWRTLVQIMKLPVMQSYPVSCRFLSPRPNFISQRPIFRTPSTCILSVVWQTKFHTHIKHWQNYSLLLYFNLDTTEIKSSVVLLSPAGFSKDPFSNMILHEHFVGSVMPSIKFGCLSYHLRISSF